MLLCILLVPGVCIAQRVRLKDTVLSTPAQTIAYIDSIGSLPVSPHWPNMDAGIFFNNLKTFTTQPFDFYEGKSTNFCAYSAITYIPLKYDPLGFAKFLIKLYLNGQAVMGNKLLNPGNRVKEQAGLLKYKGVLDINHAGQMWFLTLADQFKGYLNYDRVYQPGDENRLWASTNFKKFNRMLRRLYGTNTESVGTDLVHPYFKNVYTYLRKQLDLGTVYIYLNNRKLNKKSHKKALLNFPTHYILLTDIRLLPDGNIEIVYWDYGKQALRQLSPSFLKKIIYGVTTWTFKKQRP